MNVYLVILEGEDLFIKVVDEETFNWINSSDPGQPDNHPVDPDNPYSWKDQIVPKIQLEKLEEYKQNRLKNRKDPEEIKYVMDEIDRYFEITSGSFDNDRMLAAFSPSGYDDMVFDSIRDAKKFIKQRGDKFISSIEGGVY